MGNCISQPGVSESDPPAGDESRARRFLARLRRGVRRHRPQVGVASSSPTETRATTESNEPAKIPSPHEVPPEVPAPVKPPTPQKEVPEQSEADPPRSCSPVVDGETPCATASDAPHYATTSDTFVYTTVSSLIALFDDDDSSDTTIDNSTDIPAKVVKSEPLATSRNNTRADYSADKPLSAVKSEPLATPRENGQPVKIGFYKQTKSPAEIAVHLTVKNSLDIIAGHAGCKGTVAIPIYVRSLDRKSPRLVTVYATRKEIKNGAARKLVLKMKNVASRGPDHFRSLSVNKMAQRKHLGRPPGLVSAEISCTRWIQKESTAQAHISRAPTFDVGIAARMNTREKMGLTNLQKYNITIQCKAIERIKVDEDEFPGILPATLRIKWSKRMKKDRVVIE